MGTQARIEDIVRRYKAEVLADIEDGIVPPDERAGKLFARYHGIADPRIEIDYEYRH